MSATRMVTSRMRQAAIQNLVAARRAQLRARLATAVAGVDTAGMASRIAAGVAERRAKRARERARPGLLGRIRTQLKYARTAVSTAVNRVADRALSAVSPTRAAARRLAQSRAAARRTVAARRANLPVTATTRARTYSDSLRRGSGPR
jgi:hypothetical protein